MNFPDSSTPFPKKEEVYFENKERESAVHAAVTISEEAVIQILEGLELFEKEQQYREKGITQGKLATRLQTNTKYLSLVIKNYKAENFNLYINKLRISYVVEKLADDPEYRKYKISYLADETGFATHSAFTRTFREITGATPSSYISSLK
ncbi:MAG: helix-turn-helix domain-containing protein [Chryseobacterium sp.]|uniref:helix-turn-helix domain-containing protein n=1 Tax=Chryseobacterium sp. TaxID=1871047 RepID=UPI0025BB398B|nr:helix-turn-helix domain-containing protein [Chryseobacterium sp.]MCJ7935657.1 helix-turn-helix domain-containing protein [Chryseobacterium sp.]